MIRTFICRNLEHHFLTKHGFETIKKQMDIYYPGSPQTARNKSLKWFLYAQGFSLGAFGLLLLFGRWSLYYVLLAAGLSRIIHREMLQSRFHNVQRRLMEQFERFLSNVHFHYGLHNMVEEAVEDSLEEADYEMGLQVGAISRLLWAGRGEGEEQRYLDTAPNRHFVAFFALCEMVTEVGDKAVKGKSLFLTNVSYIKEEVHLYILKQKRAAYLFSGLRFVALAPIFAVKPIEIWAISNLEQIQAYYEGGAALLSTMLCFLVTYGCYFLISRLQYDSRPEYGESRILGKISSLPPVDRCLTWHINRHYGYYLKKSETLKSVGQIQNVKLFMSKQILFALAGFMLANLTILNMHSMTRNQLLGAVNVPGSLFMNRGEVEDLNSDISRFLRDNKGISPEEELRGNVQERYGSYGENLSQEIYEYVRERLARYQGVSYNMFHLLLALGMGVFGYCIPELALLLRKQMLRFDREDEVMGFQTIILILMHMDRTNVKTILLWMERYARAFRDSIARAVDGIEYAGMDAVRLMKKREQFQPFTRICDGLLACDRIPVAQAFEEIEADRGYYLDRHRQENEALLNDKSALARTVTFVPMFVVMTCKLIIPFVFEGLRQLAIYAGGLQDFYR